MILPRWGHIHDERNERLEWAFGHGPNTMAAEVRRSTGAILGRTQLVRRRDPEVPRAAEDPEITFLSTGLEGAMATARAAAGGKSLVIFGANTARQCPDAGLLDEIVIHLAPGAAGRRRPPPRRVGVGRVDLERSAVDQSGQLTDLRFRVAT
jgi:dihydrofolate reductase